MVRFRNKLSFAFVLLGLATVALIGSIRCDAESKNLCEQLKTNSSVHILGMSPLYNNSAFFLMATNYHGYEVDLAKFTWSVAENGKNFLDLRNATEFVVKDETLNDISQGQGKGGIVVTFQFGSYIMVPHSPPDKSYHFLELENKTALVEVIIEENVPQILFSSEMNLPNGTTVASQNYGMFGAFDQSNSTLHYTSYKSEFLNALRNTKSQQSSPIKEPRMVESSGVFTIELKSLNKTDIDGGFLVMEPKSGYMHLFAVSNGQKKIYFVGNLKLGTDDNDHPGAIKRKPRSRVTKEITFADFLRCDSEPWKSPSGFFEKCPLGLLILITLGITLLVIIVALCCCCCFIGYMQKKSASQKNAKGKKNKNRSSKTSRRKSSKSKSSKGSSSDGFKRTRTSSSKSKAKK